MAFRIQLLSPAREWITTGPAFLLFEDAQKAQAKELARLDNQAFCGCRLAVEILDAEGGEFDHSLLPGIFPITSITRIEDLGHVSFLGRYMIHGFDFSTYSEEFPEWMECTVSIRDLEMAFAS